ncbi:crossover junction endonuclease MUS81 [Aspergillus clavatus NRRL 1]|uniref:Crossover junction endonuclease MUS81 n=1 Tax=Aspergillus clavatus (strain ATCC 1007 / CBS 513.65 / DSM 816 / NCTC 3887 / NRRL 1 / QM 1276 / 107) TaxID=344612 RepID=A1CL20_ASPCL|nr:DNA repair protein Mus81, putative [Aspergillus clavatus NRRL 1]EAW09844.1 DNA repair protein Mus81, putative [Aspergillus clavatus NRRL 1]
MDDTCANPLLLGWLKEWLDQARERGSKGVTVYKKAYESMKACPLVFQHPSEAQQLNGLGPKLCDRLTDRLKAYCEENGLPMPEHPQKAAANKRQSDGGDPDSQPAKKQRKAKPYVPSLRSGPYALLLGLATLDENASQGLTKAQLIEKAQPHCDNSFTVPPDASKFYTAWSSMKTLMQKELVYDHGRPLRKYALTEEGWEVAKRIMKTLPGSEQSTLTFRHRSTTIAMEQFSENGEDTNAGVRRRDHGLAAPDFLRDEACADDEDIQIHDQIQTQKPFDDSRIEPITLPANSFTVQLVLDTREVRSSKDRDYIANELSKKGITPEVRALELGDAMWVARCNDPSFLFQYGEECNEAMLDWIVERKRLDDLIGSIKDGRFHEQKFRLRRSGIKNVIYLIEEYAAVLQDMGNPSTIKYQEMVASAIASTQVVNGYFVKQTKNLDDTIRYLARMTSLLQKMYCFSPPTHTLRLIPSRQLSSAESYLTTLERLRAQNPSITYAVTFSTFSALTSKSDILSLRDVYLKMLMCTRGVTGDKALEIQKRWPTPREFIEAFEKLDPKDRDDLVFERTKTLVGRKKMGKVLSKKIADIWGVAG